MSAADKELSSPKQAQSRVMAMAYGKELVVDQQRVQSIVWSLTDSMRAKIDKAREDEGDDQIGTSEPEAFIQNVNWLFDVLENSASNFMKAVDEAWPELR